METDSFKQGEKSIIENNSEEGESFEPMPDGRDVLSTSRIRRSVRDDISMDGEVFRKSLLAYNWSILWYFSPVFYLVYYITQNV